MAGEVVAAFAYAALHDAFQGPFGHALDAIREELVGGLHADRRLDKALLNYILGMALNHAEGTQEAPGSKEAPAAVKVLCEVIDKTIATPNGIDLRWLLKWIHDASLADHGSLDEGAKSRRRELGWLYELLEGPIDADRWDYLWRDTLHLGFTRDNDEIAELLRDFLVDVSVHWDGERSRLSVSSSVAKRLGVSFFLLRKNLYKNVYENPEKRIIDSILVRCIYLGLLPPAARSADWMKIDLEYIEFVVNLVHITDSELLFILEQSSDLLIVHLARELRAYPSIRVFWQEVLRDEELRIVLRMESKRLESFRYKGMSPPAWAVVPEGHECSLGEKVEFALEEVVDKLYSRAALTNVVHIGKDSTTSLLIHCTVMPKRPARILQMERVIWRLVKSQLLNSGIVEKVVAAMVKPLEASLPFSPSHDQIMRSVDLCPPFFVSFPWIASLSEKTIQEMGRDPTAGKICIRHDDKRDIEEVSPADLMPRTDDSETYIAVAGYPLYVVADLSEEERNMFESTAKWATAWVVKYGCCLALPRELVNSESDVHIVNFLRAKVREQRM